MDLPPNFHPDLGPRSSSLQNSDIVSTPSSFGEEELGAGLCLDRFRSLTKLKWGEFESLRGYGIFAQQSAFERHAPGSLKALTASLRRHAH